MSEQSLRAKKFFQLKLKQRSDLLNVLNNKVSNDDREVAYSAKKEITIPRTKVPPAIFIFGFVFIALLVALFIRSFFFQVFYVASSSMKPSLNIGDRVLVNKFTYGVGNPIWGASENKEFLWILSNPFHGEKLPFSRRRFLVAFGIGPKRGDIVVFKSPAKKSEESITMVKRVIAVPGDEVRMIKGMVFVNGRQFRERNIKKDLYNYGPIIVRPDHYFVLGDNRSKSMDSRSFGPLSAERIIGVVQMRVWPMNKLGGII